MASKADEEENYWPGYVDALTTMTMVLTFIMMVLAFAVFIMSQNISKVKVDVPPMETQQETVPKSPQVEAVEQVVPRSPVEPEPIETVQTPQATPGAGGIQDASEKVAGSSPFENRIEAPESVVSKPLEERETRVSVIETQTEPKGQAIAVSTSVLTLTYEGVETRLVDEKKAEIIGIVSAPEIRAADNVITIRAYANAVNAPISQMRRVAYYRAMLLRSALMEAGISKDRIDVKLVETDNADEGQKVRLFLAPDAE